MRLRPFIPDTDFEAVRSWVTDERTHALWCARRFAWPLEKEDFCRMLRENGNRSGDTPFVMTADSGEAAGFFCYSLNPASGEGMLKFIIVDPALRGKGTGKAMLRLALDYAFSVTKADAVRLRVFPENTPALKCYEGVGFAAEKTEKNAFPFREETWSRCSMVIRRPAELKVKPIGRVRNQVAERKDVSWGADVSSILLEEPFRPGLKGLEDFSHAIILFWLDRARFDPEKHLQRRPRNRDDMPRIGIFAQRGKDRPNPIGVTAVEILSVTEDTLVVKGLDAIDGTPVLDIKPYYPAYDQKDAAVPEWVGRLMEQYF